MKSAKPEADLVVMDWGIGGLSVYNEIRRRQPDLSILYFSDAGRTPYGKMSARELRQRVRELVLSFANRGIRHFVIACNAASTALPSLRQEFAERDLLVTGVIAPGIAMIRNSSFKTIGVIGGRRTILSRHFTRPFRSQRRLVLGRIAQPLSALIERGDLHGVQMQKELAKILKPLRNCDALVLACTHYPAIAPQIQRLLPACTLLDPALATAEHIHASWRLRPHAHCRQIFMTTGNAAEMIQAARLAFGNRIAKVTEI